tara:strand:- start:1520 stop:2377 length:858 start_codon:yes stop_codon:yes gene_type:complete
MSQVIPAYATYVRHSTGLTSGVVTNTYGTAVNQVLPDWAKGILGMAVVGVLPTVTAAEGHASKVRINIKSRGISNEEFIAGCVTTSAPATNEAGYPAVVEFIPLDIAINGGETITLDVAPLGSSTAGMLFEVCYLLSNAPAGLPKSFTDALLSGSHLALRGGAAVTATQLTVVRTALTNIDVEASKVIVAASLSVIKDGAITTAEEGLGTIEFDTSVVPEFVIPACFATSAALGTPVGSGMSAVKIPKLPCYIPTPNKQITITPFITLRTAVSTANIVAASLNWR